MAIQFNHATDTATANDNIVTIGDANGALQIGAGTGIVATAAAGMVRWSGGRLQVSNGTSWLNITTTSGTSGLSADDAFAIAVALS